MKKHLQYLLLPAIVSCHTMAPDTVIPVSNAVKIIDGNMLFKNNCARCHKAMEDATGPALQDCFMQRKSKWIYTFLTDRKAVEVDSISKALQRVKSTSDSFPYLTLEEVGAIGNSCSYEDRFSP